MYNTGNFVISNFWNNTIFYRKIKCLRRRKTIFIINALKSLMNMIFFDVIFPKELILYIVSIYYHIETIHRLIEYKFNKCEYNNNLRILLQGDNIIIANTLLNVLTHHCMAGIAKIVKPGLCASTIKFQKEFKYGLIDSIKYREYLPNNEIKLGNAWIVKFDNQIKKEESINQNYFESNNVFTYCPKCHYKLR